MLVNLLVLLEVADRLDLKHDLEIARNIQLAMLPHDTFVGGVIEVAGHTRPANTVGGDLYDILPLDDDRLMAVRDGRTTSKVHATFTFGAQLNHINTALEGESTIFEGGTNSLEIREGAEDLLNRRISPIALIETAAGYWGETKFTEENSTFDPQEDYGHPVTGEGETLYLAGAVIRGNATNDQTAGFTSRMVVIANSSFLHPQRLHDKQIDFLKNTSNWLIGREDLMGIGPKPIQRYKINLVPSQVAFVNRLNLYFIPAALLLAGLAIWSVRRS